MSLDIVFALFTFIIIAASLIILISNNVLYAAVGLMISLLGVAGIFVLAQADFLAVTQIMIYIGGTLTLMIFGIMLSKRADLHLETKIAFPKIFRGVSIAALVAGGLLYLLSQVNWTIVSTAEPKDDTTTVYTIGELLLTKYLFPFELIAVILLISLVGAAFVASKNLKNS
ncbi:NADH-quinone oxidoreductase subunit J [Cyclobacteriaceae bacterium]|nr:NADH-quinone oxidoreductase subunit J [Cyclobacteriaceae bacterium]